MDIYIFNSQITISVYQLIRTINKNDTLKRRETGYDCLAFKLIKFINRNF